MARCKFTFNNHRKVEMKNRPTQQAAGPVQEFPRSLPLPAMAGQNGFFVSQICSRHSQLFEIYTCVPLGIVSGLLKCGLERPYFL